MESLWRGRFVEVQITAEHLVCPFAAEHHFDAHAFDDTCQQVHGGGCAHCCHVVGFDEVDDIAEGIQSFLNGVVDFVMNRTDVLRHFTSFE